jgi:hypothetical protein
MSSAVGGLQLAQNSLEKVAGRLAKATGAPPGIQQDPAADPVDLSTEMVNLLAARNQFQINARVIQTDDQMRKMTLSLLA